ncbi:MAG: hypothetical protein LBV69_06965 [Bacteroidales bacterium]|jgi:tetratricopeptide (TPR) repeat protein|nr:hypothetical protein [Bacteroidales bacterium]
MVIFKNDKYLIFTFLFNICILFSNVSFSQQQNNTTLNSDIQLASRYFNSKEFDKAAILYKKIYSDTKFKSYRDMYLRCLFENKDIKIAENFINSEIKKLPNDFYLKIDLGITYTYQNKTKEANEIFEKVIDLAKRNNVDANGAANSFISYRQYELAEKTYKEAEKILKISFDYELGNLYYIIRDYEKMMETYCKLALNADNTMISTIQSRLQFIQTNAIDDDFDQIIEQALLKNLQKNPDNLNLSKLLIWQYIQTGRYKLALNQYIAIDKRTKSNEGDILSFAITLKNNQEFNIAEEAVTYILNKGQSSEFYKSAFIENLDIKFSKVTDLENPTQTVLAELETLTTEGINYILKKDSYKLISNLAIIKAFYLNKSEESLELLNNYLEQNIFTREQVLQTKLLMADIYLLSGNQWDAILYYAQVEKSAIESPIGHEARYKKAKLAYYVGQFRWAQAQLEVLKASTSKLIANDALELSIFISENYDMDTTETTMQMFARADFYYFSKQYQNSLSTIDSILIMFPMSSLIDDALFRKATIFEVTGKNEDAAIIYQKIYTDYFYDILADNALYKYALIQEKLKNYEKADDTYFKLISDYPSSVFTVEARNKLRIKRNNEENIWLNKK